MNLEFSHKEQLFPGETTYWFTNKEGVYWPEFGVVEGRLDAPIVINEYGDIASGDAEFSELSELPSMVTDEMRLD